MWTVRSIILLLAILCPVFGADSVIFTPSSTVGVTNYSICYGPYPTRSVTNRVHIGTNTSWVITNVAPATIAFIHATAWANGIESDPSNEILYTNRNFAPQTLRLTGSNEALALQTTTDLQSWRTLAIISSGDAPLSIHPELFSIFRVETINPPLP
jgi:hypothetical protein